jgi:hypothetical protein
MRSRFRRHEAPLVEAPIQETEKTCHNRCQPVNTNRNPGLSNGGNPLKLGLFGSNCSNGRSYTTVPERWDASW